ncbi:hypothetical protein, partial [Klebsiella aerogenes]|uniref:hypothetical protein n=1 Tax=Klebsiella aerogenes TaxID=548 RepID=UPI001CBDCA8D
VENLPALTKNANFETAINRILAEHLPMWDASTTPRTSFRHMQFNGSFLITNYIKSSRDTASKSALDSAIKQAAFEFF